MARHQQFLWRLFERGNHFHLGGTHSHCNIFSYYLPSCLRKFGYLKGASPESLKKSELLQISKSAAKQGEKLAVKIAEKRINSNPETADRAHNIFLTPAEYQNLLKKSTMELPDKK